MSGGWSELLQMLVDGEIDLLGDISYTVGRSRTMLFSMLPMGAEEYYVFISSRQHSGIDAGDFASFNGKKVGANQGSVQADMFAKWAGMNAHLSKPVEPERLYNTLGRMINRK